MTADVAFSIVIPARYGSSRFPGKPLALIGDEPMIVHVWRLAISSGAQRVVIATDHESIASVCESVGASVCMKSTTPETGTDRIAEVVERHDWPDDDIVVNLQGDEPQMPAPALLQVARNLRDHADASIATLSTPINDESEARDPNVVKVVTDSRGMALYFSRSSIPYQRGKDFRPATLHRHLGLYAFRARFLREFQHLPQAPIEQNEMLEQLRALWFGKKIHCETALALPGAGIDTPEQLAQLQRQIQGKERNG